MVWSGVDGWSEVLVVGPMAVGLVVVKPAGIPAVARWTVVPGSSWTAVGLVDVKPARVTAAARRLGLCGLGAQVGRLGMVNATLPCPLIGQLKDGAR